MASEQITARLGTELIERLDAYAAEHGMDRAAVVRLAVILQLGRKPPRTLPDGVELSPGNPDPAAAGRKGAAVRWGKRRRKKAAE